MIEIQLTQTVRILCDYCGKPAGLGGWFPDAIMAREDAVLHGFKYHHWTLDGGAHRDLILCPECNDKDPNILPAK